VFIDTVKELFNSANDTIDKLSPVSLQPVINIYYFVNFANFCKISERPKLDSQGPEETDL